MFPGVDGGGEWGGAAFDPGTGLLYVNSNEMPWMVKLVPNDDTSLYSGECAAAIARIAPAAAAPSLVDIGKRTNAR